MLGFDSGVDFRGVRLPRDLSSTHRNDWWNSAMVSPFTIFVILIVAFAVIFVAIAVKSVPQGYEWTVERCGRYVRTLEPGLALLIPIVDRVGARLNMMETVLEVPQQSVITRDNAVATVDAIVFYQVAGSSSGSWMRLSRTPSGMRFQTRSGRDERSFKASGPPRLYRSYQR